MQCVPVKIEPISEHDYDVIHDIGHESHITVYSDEAECLALTEPPSEAQSASVILLQQNTSVDFKGKRQSMAKGWAWTCGTCEFTQISGSKSWT